MPFLLPVPFNCAGVESIYEHKTYVSVSSARGCWERALVLVFVCILALFFLFALSSEFIFNLPRLLI